MQNNEIKVPASIVDVRTPEEFNENHVPGSINIPLQTLQSRLTEVQSLPSPIALCCASGMRSDRATSFLRSEGVDCFNAGSWFEAQQLKTSL